MPRFVLRAALAACIAASLGTACLASSQWLHAWRQHCLARSTSLHINGCAHCGSIAWHMVPRFVSGAACIAASLGTGRFASNQWLHMHHLTAAHKVAVYAWHVMPRLAQQPHSWLQLQSMARDATHHVTAAHMVTACAQHVIHVMPLQERWARNAPPSLFGCTTAATALSM